jgi:DNA-binding NarL/FixJ family response regulator
LPLENGGHRRIIGRPVPPKSRYSKKIGTGSGEEQLPAGYTFVIADDHPLFRGALREALAGIGDAAAIHEAGDFESAKALVLANGDIDLVLLDLSMPGASGLSGLITLRGIHPTVPVVVVSAHDDPVTIRRALELGASGFISKSAGMEAIRGAVQTVLAGDIASPAGVDLGVERDPEISDLIDRLQTLTPQQTRVLGMLAEGLLNKQIAYELGVSEATIKAHVSAILQKLNVDSRTQAVILLSKIGSDPLQAAG